MTKPRRQRLETRLWGMEPDRQVMILVPACESVLTGASLSIIGGTQIAGWHRAIASPPPRR